MTLHRRAKRRDANEGDICDALEAVGAYVYRLDVPLDLLVGFRGETYLIEVKLPLGPKGGSTDRRLTDDQAEFFRDWRGRPPVIVRTVDEGLAAIGLEVCSSAFHHGKHSGECPFCGGWAESPKLRAPE